jgi:hypothetical protein
MNQQIRKIYARVQYAADSPVRVNLRRVLNG